MVITNHHDAANPHIAIRFDDVPEDMKLVLAGPKHGIKATIVPTKMPTDLCIKDFCSFDKVQEL